MEKANVSLAAVTKPAVAQITAPIATVREHPPTATQTPIPIRRGASFRQNQRPNSHDPAAHLISYAGLN